MQESTRLVVVPAHPKYQTGDGTGGSMLVSMRGEVSGVLVVVALLAVVVGSV